MNGIQVFDVVYLIAIFAMLVALLVFAFIRSRHDQKILQLLVAISAKNAESAENSVKVAQNALDLLREVVRGHSA